MRYRFLALGVALATWSLLPQTAQANARLVSVVPVASACVAGPTGPNVEAWDVQPGQSYVVTIDQATNCANGGTDASIQVIVKNSVTGNVVLTATRGAVGVYSFTFTTPMLGCETSPILYCTSGGQPNTGFLVGRHDTGASQSHLRVSNFGAGCTNPVQISCATSAVGRSWGRLKVIYR